MQPVRWSALDAARGAAILAMIVYHLAWDLSFVRLIAVDVVEHPAWQLFARTIAASFLMLVGISLALAHPAGVRWRSFLRRLAVIAAAALVITIVTRIAFPDEYILFGILHCIAVSSVLALPLRRAPLIALLSIAAFCFMAPALFTDPALDAPILDWLGLGAASRPANDYVPIFPWFGFVLLGLVASRFARRRAFQSLWSSNAPAARVLIWAGRRSLLIYMVHQPILLGGLLLLVQVTGTNPAAEDAHFGRLCEASCVDNVADRAVCGGGCACAAERLKAAGLWPKALAANTTAAEQDQLKAAAQECFRSPAAPSLP